MKEKVKLMITKTKLWKETRAKFVNFDIEKNNDRIKFSYIWEETVKL